MPCVISAAMLFRVDTFGVDSSRPLPDVSSADSATSRLNAPLIDPSIRPTALDAAGAARFTAVDVPPGPCVTPGVPPTRPPSEPLLGNDIGVVLPSAGDTLPLKPHCT